MAQLLRRPWLVAAIAIAAVLVFASCSGGKTGGNKTVTPGNGGQTTITIWHSILSPVDGYLQRIIDDFNKSQSKYHVEMVYQGSYTQSLNKLISSIGSKDTPTLIQLDDVATQIMIDSGEITPVQQFIDKEHYDLSDFEPKALAYYSQNGTLYSMPFNLSAPILFYDKQAFSDAGLDPNKPPQTLDEARADAEKLVKKDASGNITRYGMALQVSPWFFENMLAKQGALLVNNDNGRTARATEAAFASPEGNTILTWYRDMINDKIAYYAQDDTDALLSVAQQRTSMAIGSTAVVGAALALVSVAGQDPQRVGTAEIPAPLPPAGTQGGAVLGGASMWILKRKSQDEQQGAWEFLKFASTPEQQARWYASTGYFPTRVSSYDLPEAKQRQEQFPQYRTASEQVRNSPSTPATEGALDGRFNQLRDNVTRAFEQVLGGGSDPATELKTAAAASTNDMQDYNRTVK
jgi:sn-glycerol 3-phosphate transport system substrate-binding protein